MKDFGRPDGITTKLSAIFKYVVLTPDRKPIVTRERLSVMVRRPGNRAIADQRARQETARFFDVRRSSNRAESRHSLRQPGSPFSASSCRRRNAASCAISAGDPATENVRLRRSAPPAAFERPASSHEQAAIYRSGRPQADRPLSSLTLRHLRYPVGNAQPAVCLRRYGASATA